MQKSSAIERSSAVSSAAQALSTAEQRPTATPARQPEASTGIHALEVTGNEISQGLTRPKAHPCAQEVLIRGQLKKIEAKEAPYESNNGVSGVNLNGRVPVKPNESSDDSALVVCRHLATRFAQEGGKKSDVVQAFSTPEGIAEKFDGKLTEAHAAYRNVIEATPLGCKHLVNSEQLGAYLKAMATQLQVPGSGQGPSQGSCLLLTANHAMAVQVERKSKNGVEYFSAKFYDPNETANYRRVVKANPEDFCSLRLQDLMIRPQLISHYARGENKPLSMVAMSLDHRLQPPMARKNTMPSVENMHLALRVGQSDEVRSMLKTALEQGQTPHARFELLQANDLTKGRAEPGLFSALGKGQSDAIRVFAQHVLASQDLNDSAKVELFSAKCSDGVPGLYAAFQNGHPDATKVFVQEVLASNLSKRAKVDLLAAKTSDGAPGLYVAFQNGHADAVKVFTQEVLASQDLNPQEKFDLLVAKFSGAPGLFVPFALGHSDSVKVFAQEVLASTDLTAQAKVDLLTARHDHGVAGLSVAQDESHKDTVSVFTQIVRQSSLSEAKKDELLSPFLEI